MPCSGPNLGGCSDNCVTAYRNDHAMAAKEPRQANPKITLTPMTKVCRPARSAVAPCFDEEGVLAVVDDALLGNGGGQPATELV